MKAVVFRGVRDVRVEDVPEPRIVDPTDAVVRITTSAICGSDLHQYHGRGGALVQPGAVMGHEFMGVVEAVGAEVRAVRPGDRVVAPFSVSCGRCPWCRRGLPTQCTTTGRAVFGGRFGHVYPGGQAAAIRVPFADDLCEPVPAAMPDEDALFVGDILATAYACAEAGGIRPGDAVAVVGAGPVGLLAVQAAHLFGAGRVFAVDCVEARLARAAEFGAEPVPLDRGDPVAALRARTGGWGPDVVLECVGHPTAFAQAIEAVRAGGTVASVGVYLEPAIEFPAREAFFKDLTLRMGICNARNSMTALLGLVRLGKLQPARIVTHTLPLAEAPRGYEIFDRKAEGAIKVLLKP